MRRPTTSDDERYVADGRRDVLEPRANREMSTFLRYLKLQLQSLSCLGFGPLFLVLYLAGGPQKPSWMLWWGLGITVFSVFVALVATKIGANTMFSPRTEDDPDDPTVDDSDSFAGRLRGGTKNNPYDRFLPPNPRE